MENIMKNGKRTMIITVILLLALGIIFIVWPEQSLLYICRAVGIALIVYAAVQLTRFLSNKEERTAAVSALIALHLIILAFGVVFEIVPQILMSIWPIIVGIILIFNGALNVVQSINIKKAGRGAWWLVLVLGLAMLGFGIFIFVHPLETMQLFMQIVGAILIYAAVADIICSVTINKGPKAKKDNVVYEEEAEEFDAEPSVDMGASAQTAAGTTPPDMSAPNSDSTQG